MSTKYGRRDRCGPGYRPVSREDKIDEWAEFIKGALRYRDGTVVADEVAAEFAELFWRKLANQQMPVKDIMGTPDKLAAEWALGEARGALLDARLVTDQNPEGEL